MVETLPMGRLKATLLIERTLTIKVKKEASVKQDSSMEVRSVSVNNYYLHLSLLRLNALLFLFINRGVCALI